MAFFSKRASLVKVRQVADNQGMTAYSQDQTLARSQPWFQLSLFGLWLFAAGLRLWGLGRFNELVFDEVYFAKFANHYLTQTTFFDAHPPLGKYLIALGIWLSQHLTWLQQGTQNELTGSLLSPPSYRWMNALVGSLIPLIGAGIVYQLTPRLIYRRTFTLLTALFLSLDGLLLVESRYGLINVYLLLFGLLGHYWALIALNRPVEHRAPWLLLSGLSLGAAIAVKWNGLGFWLGLVALWAIAQGFNRLNTNIPVISPKSTPLTGLSHLTLRTVFLNWAIVPLVVYSLIWIPHLQLNHISFWEVHHNILHYHERVGNGPEVHPYCSAWYTWPLMLRPVAYFYRKITDPMALPDQLGAPILKTTGQVVYDVHAMSNPLLTWLSTAAIALLALQLLVRLGRILAQWLTTYQPEQTSLLAAASGPSVWLSGYLVVNQAANWLPWAKVSRCLFIYHYMAASIFAMLAIAYLVSRWLHSTFRWRRQAGVAVILVIIAGFLFWLPLYLGLPLSPQDLQLRWWLSSWI